MENYDHAGKATFLFDAQGIPGDGTTGAGQGGRKFEMYRTMESLTDYLLVAQDEPLVKHFSRMSDGRWALSGHKGLDAAVAIDSINCTLALADIYDKIDNDVDQPALRLVKELPVDYDAGSALARPGFSLS